MAFEETKPQKIKQFAQGRPDVKWQNQALDQGLSVKSLRISEDFLPGEGSELGFTGVKELEDNVVHAEAGGDGDDIETTSDFRLMPQLRSQDRLHM